MPISAVHRAPPFPSRAVLAMVLSLILGALALAPGASAVEPGISVTTMTAASDPGGRKDVAGPVDDEILIRYAADASPSQRRGVAREHGLTAVRASADGRTEVVTAPGRATMTVRRNLADDPRVEAVAPNEQRELADDISREPAFGELWALHNTGQTLLGDTRETGVANVDIDGLEALARGIGRPGVVVAVVDDGVDFSHPDLAARAWTNPGEAGDRAANGIDDDGNGYVDDVHGWDFCNGDNTVHDAGQDGHGTHVAGTIAASLDGRGVVGVAPGVSIMALKFIDGGRYCGRDDMAVAAIDYAASFGVPIINASWGGSRPSSVLDAAIADSGALVVAAAGNFGWNLDFAGGPRFYPASSPLPNIVAVAAVDQSGRFTAFSNYGTASVDLVAPGTNILSTYPSSAGCPAPCYAWSAGTSMATPHVSGVAALAGSAKPTLLADPIALRSRLLTTGRPHPAAVGRTSSGRLVNALRAIDADAPTAFAPDRYGFKVGTVIGKRSVKTTVLWPKATDGMTGIAGYDVHRQDPDGWDLLRRGTTATKLTSSLTYRTGYRFRVRATDGAGNSSGPAIGPVVTPRLYSDSSSLAKYGSGWRTVASSGAAGGKLHRASKRGASMTFTFTGRAVGLVAPKGASRGKVKVYVDGSYVSTVNLYRSSAISKVIVFSRSWTTSASHRIRLVVVGTAGHPRVDVDGFVVIR